MAISNTINTMSGINIPTSSNITSGVSAQYYETKTSTPSGVGKVEGTNGIEKQLINAIEKANQLKRGTTECQFSIHQETKQVMIKLVDSTTKEVIKEIPSEKILDMFATMCEAAGLFVDTKR